MCFEHFLHKEMAYFGKVSALTMWHPGINSCLNCLGHGGEDNCSIFYQDTEQLVLIAGAILKITIFVIIIAYFLFSQPILHPKLNVPSTPIPENETNNLVSLQ